jgi:hypothetical protein
MKHCYLLFCALMGMLCATRATTYYSQGSLSPNSLLSWNTNRLGGGNIPGSFTTAGDEFIIQATHVLYTTGTWTIGSSSSTLRIEEGGVLHAAHPIQLTGTFQIQNGGTYYHDNRGAVTGAAGTSIFGGTESFAAGSKVEIRNWINNTTPLPSGITWGTLSINYSTSIGGNWNQDAALTNIQGNLLIKRTGIPGESFRLTNNASLTLNIAGDLELEQAILFIKEGNAGGTSSIVQVGGNILIGDGTLNLGTVDLKPNNELRFKGSLLILGAGSITAQNEEPMLVANGTNVQAFYSPLAVNASFKIAPGASMKLNSALNFGTARSLIVAGAFNAGSNPISLNSGTLAVPGGTLSSNATINMKDGVCQVCQGNGTFSFSTGWCATTGDTGVINFSTESIIFNKSLAAAMKVGDFGSKGKLFLTNGARISFTGPASGPAPNRGSFELAGNGTLSFDETSFAVGDAFYNGNGGLLIVGDVNGLTTSGGGGNIQVTGSRNYNNIGVNSYEYKSTRQQFTGNGLPSMISGTLRINNTNSLGVTLTNAVTILSGATLHMARGLLKTNSNSGLLTMNSNSNFVGGSSLAYIDGPLKKIGNQDFTFHVGKSGRYSPVLMIANNIGTTSDNYTVEYVPGDPTVVFGNVLFQFIEHISSVEHWVINGTNSRFRQLRFNITPYSGVTHFPTLVMAYFDGSGWLNMGTGTKTGNPNTGTMQVDATNYGAFAFGSTDAVQNAMIAALPIKVNAFTARRNGNAGVLDWEVSKDTDAEYFEVLASTDNRTFVPIAKVNAVNGQYKYQFTEPQLKKGTNYYRLKIVEKSGIYLYSRIVALFYSVQGLELISVAPTIVQQQTTVSVVTSDRSNIQLYVVDAQGKQLIAKQVSLVQGTNNIPLNTAMLGAGLYYVYAVSSEGKTNVLRFVKQ